MKMFLTLALTLIVITFCYSQISYDTLVVNTYEHLNLIDNSYNIKQIKNYYVDTVVICTVINTYNNYTYKQTIYYNNNIYSHTYNKYQMDRFFLIKELFNILIY